MSDTTLELHSPSQIFAKILEFHESTPKGIIEILGATASGKTAFSFTVVDLIRKKYDKMSEIISADSRQVFRGIDISSAKVTPEEQRLVPHHGINIIDLNESYSAYEFQQYAFQKIREIHQREAVPIVVGGTMLYLDAVSENYVFSEPGEKSKERKAPLYPFLKVGVYWDRAKLYERINQRAKGHFEQGLVEEIEYLYSLSGVSPTAKTSFGYHELHPYISGDITLEEALTLNQQRNRRYAKRQLTWWRNRNDILWVDGAQLV